MFIFIIQMSGSVEKKLKRKLFAPETIPVEEKKLKVEDEVFQVSEVRRDQMMTFSMTSWASSINAFSCNR